MFRIYLSILHSRKEDSNKYTANLCFAAAGGPRLSLSLTIVTWPEQLDPSESHHSIHEGHTGRQRDTSLVLLIASRPGAGRPRQVTPYKNLDADHTGIRRPVRNVNDAWLCFIL